VKLTVLLVPSRAAAMELPRRLAAIRGALAGPLPMKVMDLAAALAEPTLLGRGLRPWDSGHGALLAARVLEETPAGPLSPRLPRAPVARVIARTFSELRLAGLPPEVLARLPERVGGSEDGERLVWLAQLYRKFHDAIEGRFADAATFLRAAAGAIDGAAWLKDADVLIAGELELTPLEQAFVAALARARPVRRLAQGYPPSLRPSSFAEWADAHGIPGVATEQTLLAPLSHEVTGGRLVRLRERLFEPPDGPGADDDSAELVTAPGEGAEVRALTRRILREAARGVPFDDMGVLLARPEEYARLFTDLLTRLGIPHRLHPSLPLRYGRAGRSLLLLFRCRGLRRSEVMEFLTFAPVPFKDRLGPEVVPRVAQWDLLSREAGIVSGLERWAKGAAAVAREAERDAAAVQDDIRRERHLKRAHDAQVLLRLVTRLDMTVEELSGEAPWTEWSERLLRAFDLWIGEAPGEAAERATVRDLLQHLATLGFAAPSARWEDVEAVIESRLDWERIPLEAMEAGGVHVGSMDALAGVPFRWVAIPGLVEGGFPGVLRPDPLLLDREREALAAVDVAPPPAPPASPKRAGQMSLFDDEPEVPTPAAPEVRLPTTQDRLREARRSFHLAAGQATERLVLSYPRADPRGGRERLPSLFFVAAATALAGRAVGAADLERMVVEDVADELPLEETLDASERDRSRVRAGGTEAALAIAAGSRFFKQSHLASRARWSKELTPYDGLVAGPPVTPELARRLDPVTAEWPISASRLATFAQCGFKYLLENVLRLEPAPEPEERMRLDPLERGSLFHGVAERFLRERRDGGLLPVRDTHEERVRLREIADEELEQLVAGAPPRFTVLWERERTRFHHGIAEWLTREARHSDTVPVHFEVGFGVRRAGAPGEPHSAEPLVVELGEGRTLRVSGKIDRIDRRSDGALVIRDYKTGRAPRKDDGGQFRGGRQLQIPFYVLAAERLFPGQRVAQAFLDYVDGGRRVDFDLPSVTGEGFRNTLQRITGLVAQGTFVQEPSACEWCDFKGVCGPRRLLELRREFKINDRRIQQYLRLRDIP
jgi:ATP-dependent helicase/nuclease subunit B